MQSTTPSNSTELTEMSEFFPVAQRKKAAQTRAVPMLPGETYEEAVKRHDERAARIKAALAAREAA